MDWEVLAFLTLVLLAAGAVVALVLLVVSLSRIAGLRRRVEQLERRQESPGSAAARAPATATPTPDAAEYRSPAPLAASAAYEHRDLAPPEAGLAEAADAQFADAPFQQADGEHAPAPPAAAAAPPRAARLAPHGWRRSTGSAGSASRARRCSAARCSRWPACCSSSTRSSRSG